MFVHKSIINASRITIKKDEDFEVEKREFNERSNKTILFGLFDEQAILFPEILQTKKFHLRSFSGMETWNALLHLVSYVEKLKKQLVVLKKENCKHTWNDAANFLLEKCI